jgi:hypothetical protein
MFMLRVGWGRTQDATFTENFTDEPDYFAHSSYESADRGARADGRVAPEAGQSANRRAPRPL